MVSDKRMDALIKGDNPINKEEQIWIKKYNEFNIERFKELLKGDKPKNSIEQQWIDNYRRKQQLFDIQRIENERIISQNTEKSYHEFYNLIKSFLPKDFFCKKPVTLEEFKIIKTKAQEIAWEKTQKVMKSRLLQIRYGILDPIRKDVEAQAQNAIFDEFTNREICKNFGVSYKNLHSKYTKYNNKEFRDKMNKIYSKYNGCGPREWFNMELWCTDYIKFRDYKA